MPWGIFVARTRRERMLGLRGRDGLGHGEALLIPRCRSVHTFGMRFPIFVAFLDTEMRVIEIIEMAPNRVARPRIRARHVLECADPEIVREGLTIASNGLAAGGGYTAVASQLHP